MAMVYETNVCYGLNMSHREMDNNFPSFFVPQMEIFIGCQDYMLQQ